MNERTVERTQNAALKSQYEEAQRKLKEKETEQVKLKGEIQNAEAKYAAMGDAATAKEQLATEKRRLEADRSKLNSEKTAMSVHSKQIDEALSHLTKERGELEEQRKRLNKE